MVSGMQPWVSLGTDDSFSRASCQVPAVLASSATLNFSACYASKAVDAWVCADEASCASDEQYAHAASVKRGEA